MCSNKLVDVGGYYCFKYLFVVIVHQCMGGSWSHSVES